MALDKQLKSDMAASPIEDISKQKIFSEQALPQNETLKPAIGSTRKPDFSASSEKAALFSAPASNSDPREAPKTQETDLEINQIDLLLSIKEQLQSLNKNILDLGQAVNQSKNPDYRTIFSKIDSTRASIEKLISSGTFCHSDASGNDNPQIMTLLKALLEKQEKNDRQLTQTLRENASFQVQVRQGMQHDLDVLKEQTNGEQFNPLLKEIAAAYVEYQTLLDDESISFRSHKNLQALFEQLEDMLNDYGAEIYRSGVGSIRQARLCKIIERILTGNPEKHNTIANSRKPGVIRGRTVLYPEFVDVFVYDPDMDVSVNSGSTDAEDVPIVDNPTTPEKVVAADEIEVHSVDKEIENTDLGGN